MTRAEETLVLVPGLVCDDAVWHHARDHLAEIVGCLVVPADEADTIHGLAGAILDAVSGRFALAGFSMGGYIALEVLRRAPERLTRLTLLDTTARADTPEKAAGRKAAIAACESGRYDAVIEGMLPLLLHPARLADASDPLPDAVRAMAQRVGPEIFALRQRAMLTRSDSRDLLKATDIPVRVITGRDDRMASMEEHREAAALAPRGRLSVVEDCGHMPPLERPQAATALLRDWLLYD